MMMMMTTTTISQSTAATTTMTTTTTTTTTTKLYHQQPLRHRTASSSVDTALVEKADADSATHSMSDDLLSEAINRRRERSKASMRVLLQTKIYNLCLW